MSEELIGIDGELLNRRRLARGWCKKDLAARAGLSFAPVKRALDSKPVGLSTVAKLARAVGLAASTLVVDSGAVDDRQELASRLADDVGLAACSADQTREASDGLG